MKCAKDSHIASSRRVEPNRQMQQGGFASAVGANQRSHAFGRQREAAVVGRPAPTIALTQARCLQCDAGLRGRGFLDNVCIPFHRGVSVVNTGMNRVRPHEIALCCPHALCSPPWRRRLHALRFSERMWLYARRCND